MSGSAILVSLVAVLGTAGWWVAAARAREHAASCIDRACREAGLQWLDQTAILKRLELGRDAQGGRQLIRTYVFEYSEDGESRRQGFLRLRGRDIDWVGFGPVAVGGRP
jgi:hypothetical protein